MKKGSALANGVVDVKFSLLAGNEDRTAGIVWRWKDTDTYYVARAEAPVGQDKGNVALFYVAGGRPKLLRQVEAAVAAQAWHTLRVEFDGPSIRVFLDDTPRIERQDSLIAGPGAVGVWTSADSVTAFDDFSWKNEPGEPLPRAL